jgi:hypothetical protein
MTAVGDRISQLSSAVSVYGANGVISTAINSATGLPVDNQTNLDCAHATRLAADELARLSLLAARTSTGGQLVSSAQANSVALSTGNAQFGLASTRYAQSGTP